MTANKNFDWLEDCCRRLRSANSKDELENHLISTVQPAGFSDFTFLETNEVGVEYVIHCCTYPSSWLQRYFKRHYGEIDPIIQRMFSETQPYHWTAAEYKKSKDKELVDFFADAERHGIAQGVSIPLKRQGGIRLFSLVTSSAQKNISKSTITAIRLIAENFNMMFSAIEEKNINSLAMSYTPRERQVLTLSGLGATAADAANILGISPKTVERQLQSGREKMWARSQAAATSFAIDVGIINLRTSAFSAFIRPIRFPIKRYYSRRS